MHLGRWIIAPITLMLAATTVGGGPTRVAMPKSTNAFKVLSLGLVLLASPAVALRPCDDECWSAALAAYVASPRGARESLLDLERQIQPSTPAVYVLAIADARLRSGQTERAAALFRSAVARDPAGPLADWSHLGLAYAEFRAGRLVEADHQLSKVQGFTGSSKDLVDLFSASLQSLSGAHGEARRRYEKIAADDSATPAARQNAEELAALTFYWAEDYEAAVGALEGLASGRGDGPDAMGLRYAAALAHLRAGRVDKARGILEKLAQSASSRSPRLLSRSVLELQPTALLRGRFARYRDGMVGMPSAGSVWSSGFHGGILARAMLLELAGERWASAVGRTAPERRSRAHVADQARDLRTENSGDSGNSIASDSGAAARSAETTWPLLAVGAFALATLAAARRRAHRSEGVRRPPRRS